MRREIVGPGGLKAAFAAAFFLLIHIIQAGAQELPERIAALVERHVLEGGDEEELLRHYEELARRRPSINALSRKGLEATGVLSAFQIESLLDYRKTFGEILSEGELALVDGFNGEQARICAFFFSFESEREIAEPVEQEMWRHKTTLRGRHTFGAATPAITARYTLEAGRNVSAGLTADSDAGELAKDHPVPDFLSGYVAVRGGGAVKKVIIGDYVIRAGQGLACWKAFSLKAFGTPSAIIKQPRGAMPYSSSAESGYFRGAAATMSKGEMQLTLFASRHPVDARIAGDTAYTSIVTDGYHRTEAELAKRHSMHEYAAGAALAGEKGRLRYGVTALAYRYDKSDGRTVKDYNRYQQYYGWWSNISADCYLFWRNTRIFGEAAVDAGGSPALLAGALWSPGYSFEASLLGRFYSRSYIATHAGAWSSLSSCSNQRGATLSIRWLPGRNWEAAANIQYSYYPWSRYGIDGSSAAWKYRIGITRTFGKHLEASAQISGNPAPSWRASLSWGESGRTCLKLRYAGNPSGSGAVAEGIFPLSRKLRLTAGISCHSTSGWDSRIYLYRSGLPQSFSVATLYGKGAGAYLVVKYAPVRWAEIWLRISEKEASVYLTWSF
ncbi:MAG: hypothetical protein J5699_06890 [Bacteroidales bacterium]|nr:hypothetical protein [Bacteroidales bacterium]